MKVMGIRGTARMVYVKYPSKVWIELHVRQFLFMNPDDPIFSFRRLPAKISQVLWRGGRQIC
jgi:hypothetical protein